MAWLPSSHHAVHRRLRIPNLRTRSDSPPQDQHPPSSSKSLPLPGVTDPAGPPIPPERHVPNSITSSPAQSLAASQGVHVVSSKDNPSSYDTVRLVECRADRACGGHGLGRRSGLQPSELPCVRRRVIRARARSCWDYPRKLGEEAVGADDATVLSTVVRMGCAYS